MNNRKFNPWMLMSVLFLAAMTIVGCDDDDEPTPTTATLRGEITFDDVQLWSTWQDSGEVQVTLFPEFRLDPPSGWGEVPDGFFGPGVPGGTFALGAPVNAQNPLVLEYNPGQDTYSFEFQITDMTEPVTFSALTVGFRHDFIQDPSLRSATLGVYWGNENVVSHGITIRPAIGAPPIFEYDAPESFVVAPGDDLELNFRADFGFVEVWYN